MSTATAHLDLERLHLRMQHSLAGLGLAQRLGCLIRCFLRHDERFVKGN